MGRYALMSLQPFETKHGFRRGEFLKNSQTEFTFRQGVAVVQRISCWITNPGVVNCKTYHPIPALLEETLNRGPNYLFMTQWFVGCVCVCVCVKGGGVKPKFSLQGIFYVFIRAEYGPHSQTEFI